MVSTKAQARPSERGGAGVKFLIVFVALVLAANAGYHYVPGRTRVKVLSPKCRPRSSTEWRRTDE